MSDMTDRELITGLGVVTSGNNISNNGAVNLGNDRISLLDTLGTKQVNGDYTGFSIKRSAGLNTLFGPVTMNNRVFVADQPTPSPIQYITRSFGGVSDNPPRGAILNKLYMATVFHIQNGPVVKSANQTMTLEYELTQEVES